MKQEARLAKRLSQPRCCSASTAPGTSVRTCISEMNYGAGSSRIVLVRTVEAPGKPAQQDSGLSKIQQNASFCAVPSVHPGNIGRNVFGSAVHGLVRRTQDRYCDEALSFVVRLR